jgi:hypothetical protein
MLDQKDSKYRGDRITDVEAGIIRHVSAPTIDSHGYDSTSGVTRVPDPSLQAMVRVRSELEAGN